MVVVPPPQVHACLKNGYLDGYCVAEPWSSVGLLNDVGWCTTLTSDFSPMHPEKVFMVTEAFHEEEPERHISLLRALWDAAAYCDAPENREELAEMLSLPGFVDVSRAAMGNALVGPFAMGMNRETPARDAIIFHRDDANRPTLQKAAWVLDAIQMHNLLPGHQRPSKQDILNCFREDIFDELMAAIAANSTPLSSLN